VWPSYATITVYVPTYWEVRVKEYVPSPLSVTGETVRYGEKVIYGKEGETTNFDKSAPTTGLRSASNMVTTTDIEFPICTGERGVTVKVMYAGVGTHVGDSWKTTCAGEPGNSVVAPCKAAWTSTVCEDDRLAALVTCTVAVPSDPVVTDCGSWSVIVNTTTAPSTGFPSSSLTEAVTSPPSDVPSHD